MFELINIQVKHCKRQIFQKNHDITPERDCNLICNLKYYRAYWCWMIIVLIVVWQPLQKGGTKNLEINAARVSWMKHRNPLIYLSVVLLVYIWWAIILKMNFMVTPPRFCGLNEPKFVVIVSNLWMSSTLFRKRSSRNSELTWL